MSGLLLTPAMSTAVRFDANVVDVVGDDDVDVDVDVLGSLVPEAPE
jgi:hypothetical protein